MKKLLIGLFLTTSLLSFAKDDKFDYLEDKLELKYQELVDSKNNKLKVDGIDVKSFNGNTYIDIEIETFSGDGGWNKFDKNSYDKIAKEIANEVRQLLNNNEKVEINLILERDIGKDMLLNSNLY